MKHTRLSCFRSNSNVSTTENVPSCSSGNVPSSSHYRSFHTSDLDEVDSVQSDEIKECDSISRSSCFAAKLRAMSEKYFNSPTNKFFTKIYKSNPGLDVDFSCKSDSEIKKRSFSYGALPDLDKLQNTNRLADYDESPDDDQIPFLDNEDSDSGILVNDSLSSANESQTEAHNQMGTAKPSSKRKRPKRATSLGRQISSTDTNEPEEIMDHNKNVMVVKLTKNQCFDQLGILIARSKLVSQGYIVASMVPDGIASRLV